MAERETPSILVCDGKYRFYVSNGCLHADRHGEHWRDFIGDKAVHALFDELSAARDEIARLKGRVEGLEKDAARYQWLREQTIKVWHEQEPETIIHIAILQPNRNGIDETIDAKLAALTGEGRG